MKSLPRPPRSIASATAMPRASALFETLASADFFDAYAMDLAYPTQTPTEILLALTRHPSGWAESLMWLRNAIVRRVGLKDVGTLRERHPRGATDYAPGDAISIFEVLSSSDNELVLGIDDKHLDVRISIFKPDEPDNSRYILSTVVHVKNMLGRLYMMPVRRIHPLVVRAAMRRSSL